MTPMHRVRHCHVNRDWRAGAIRARMVGVKSRLCLTPFLRNKHNKIKETPSDLGVIFGSDFT